MFSSCFFFYVGVAFSPKSKFRGFEHFRFDIKCEIRVTMHKKGTSGWLSSIPSIYSYVTQFPETCVQNPFQNSFIKMNAKSLFYYIRRVNELFIIRWVPYLCINIRVGKYFIYFFGIIF